MLHALLRKDLSPVWSASKGSRDTDIEARSGHLDALWPTQCALPDQGRLISVDLFPDRGRRNKVGTVVASEPDFHDANLSTVGSEHELEASDTTIQSGRLDQTLQLSNPREKDHLSGGWQHVLRDNGTPNWGLTKTDAPFGRSGFLSDKLHTERGNGVLHGEARVCADGHVKVSLEKQWSASLSRKLRPIHSRLWSARKTLSFKEPDWADWIAKNFVEAAQEDPLVDWLAQFGHLHLFPGQTSCLQRFPPDGCPLELSWVTKCLKEVAKGREKWREQHLESAGGGRWKSGTIERAFGEQWVDYQRRLKAVSEH